ncbi:hypothetical protein IMY05_006G0160700 [Salix suchowensis]|nr:hypothetical protein IMY05_006G0160700 [Salix suchowensis]
MSFSSACPFRVNNACFQFIGLSSSTKFVGRILVVGLVETAKQMEKSEAKTYLGLDVFLVITLRFMLCGSMKLLLFFFFFFLSNVVSFG